MSLDLLWLNVFITGLAIGVLVVYHHSMNTNTFWETVYIAVAVVAFYQAAPYVCIGIKPLLLNLLGG
jgi:hypothetical protein